jgi:hypothetical protein
MIIHVARLCGAVLASIASRSKAQRSPKQNGACSSHHVFSLLPPQTVATANWTVSQGELTGHAWIDKFSKLADDPEIADCGFVERKVFFTVEHMQGRIAAGSLKIWRGAGRVQHSV